MQSMYSTVPANWATISYSYGLYIETCSDKCQIDGFLRDLQKYQTSSCYHYSNSKHQHWKDDVKFISNPINKAQQLQWVEWVLFIFFLFSFFLFFFQPIKTDHGIIDGTYIEMTKWFQIFWIMDRKFQEDYVISVNTFSLCWTRLGLLYIILPRDWTPN